MKDEIFGPILPIITIKSIDDAIKFIKERDKPLCLYYFGNCCGKNAKKISNETSSGAFVVNDCVFHVLNDELPFGGVGASGYGKLHGIFGFNSLSNQKSVLLKPAVDFFPYN